MFENYGIAPSNSGQAEASAHYSSPSFNEAVNASRFVKGFGITGLIYSLVGLVGVPLLGGGIGVGVSLFIMRYDQAKYYRILGIVVMVFAIVGAFIPFLGSTVLSGAILGKGIQVLSVLEKEGRNDEEWTPSRRRAIIGTIASGVGLLISIALMFLLTLGLAAMLLGQL
jgi:hypothetical protein